MSNAIRAIRRSLASRDYVEYSAAPFAGAFHDFSRPMAERLKSREHVGPYYMTPSKPGGERFFYAGSGSFPTCARQGAGFAFRLENANDHLTGRISRTSGYFFNDHGETIQPIIARLAHGRGFLAGQTMGRGMASTLDCETIYETAEDAARAAHDMAERAAERQREYEDAENTRLDGLT